MAKTLGLATSVFTALLLLVPWAIPCLADGPAVLTIQAVQSGRHVETTLERLERLVAEQPKDPESWYNLAAFFSEKAKDVKLSRDVVETYVRRASEANDWALMINPVYYEALRLKTTVLHQRAALEKDSALRKKLIAEADACKRKADEIFALQGRTL
jgi:hypothetical protein